MATQLQSRRGTTAQMNAFTGAEGEIAVNTSTDTLHVHDGSTAGGHALAKADGSNIATYAGSFTTLTASGAATLNTLASSGATLTGGTINGVTVGASTPSTGAFTTIAASGATTLSSTLAVTGTVTADSNLLIGQTTTSPANVNGTIAYGGADAGIIYLQRQTGTDQLRFYTGGNRLGFVNTASSTFTLGTANFPLVFQTNDTERMRIDASGNLQLGTGTPAYLVGTGDIAQLSVNRVGTSGAITNTSRSAAFINVNGANGGSSIEFSTASANNTQPTERMRIDQNGTLLLTTPSSGAYGYLNIKEAGSGDVRFGKKAGNDYDAIAGTWTNNHFSFYTNSTERMRIDSSGRLLVNTTSVLSGTAAKLQVLQTVSAHWTQRINNSTGEPYGLAIDYTSVNPNGTANQFIYCSSTTGAKFGVYSNGGVLNYSSNNVNLSDRNAKKDITIHTDNEWNCVKAWEIVDYRYKDEADDSPVKIGVIAQQIQEHCPDLVNVFQEQADAVEEVLGEDGEVVTEAKAAVEERIGVNEAQMMWKVTKALQEAMERIETLEAKVQTLENN